MPEIPPAVAEERRRWIKWLYATGYPFDWHATTPPPCTPEELAAVWREREPGGNDQSLEEWAATIREEAHWAEGSLAAAE